MSILSVALSIARFSRPTVDSERIVSPAPLQHVLRLQWSCPRRYWSGAGAAGAAGVAGAAPAGEEGAPAGEAGWIDWLSQAVSAGAGYLPAQVADVLTQGRAFAAARLPRPARRAVAAVTVVSRSARLVVVTAEGVVYVYALDAQEGGECALLRTHRLLDAAPAPPAAPDGTVHCGGPAAAGCSYAGALRGRPPAAMTESERAQELGAALAGSPPRGAFDLRDHRHFPPMRAPAAPATPAAPAAPAPDQ